MFAWRADLPAAVVVVAALALAGGLSWLERGVHQFEGRLGEVEESADAAQDLCADLIARTGKLEEAMRQLKNR